MNLQVLRERLQNWLVDGRNLGFLGRLATVIICAYFLSDLASLLIGKLIPEPPVAPKSMQTRRLRPVMDNPELYSAIWMRNLFNSRGLIPGEDASNQGAPDAAPVPTTLPFNLIGTVILEDPTKSLGTIEDTGSKDIFAVRIGDEIPKQAKILEIEAKKIIFFNMRSNRKEYVDLPDDEQSPITFSQNSGAGASKIQQVNANHFQISRSEVDKNLSNLNKILTQARAVPNFNNGVPNGYKLFQIVPGSIYSQLGLQEGDVITGLNSEPVNDPGKAFEMLNELKTNNHLELTVQRGGQSSTMVYDIQ